MGRYPRKTDSHSAALYKALLLRTPFVSPLTSRIRHFTPRERVGSSWKIYMRRDWKRSKKVFWGGYRGFFCTKDKVRGQERESECSEREGGSEQEKSLENENVYRAGAGSGCQAPRNSWSICPCLQPVCNKKGAEGQKGLDRPVGQATDCRCLYWRGEPTFSQGALSESQATL